MLDLPITFCNFAFRVSTVDDFKLHEKQVEPSIYILFSTTEVQQAVKDVNK